MDQRALLAELTQLHSMIPKLRSEGTREIVLAWGNRVLPLLQFEPRYYNMFNGAHNALHARIRSGDTIHMCWATMQSQLEQAIHDLTYQERGLVSSLEPAKLPGGVYVDQRRLDDLAALPSSRFDVSKLCVLLRELNECHQRHAYFAIAALVRTILNHVPPIFGFKTFQQVVANYKCERSFKQSIERLDDAARDIADLHLHAVIRARESLPTLVQVDFSPELDLLLGEIVRVLTAQTEPETGSSS
jgi:hypothetical protein